MINESSRIQLKHPIAVFSERDLDGETRSNADYMKALPTWNMFIDRGQNIEKGDFS